MRFSLKFHFHRREVIVCSAPNFTEIEHLELKLDAPLATWVSFRFYVIKISKHVGEHLLALVTQLRL